MAQSAAILHDHRACFMNDLNYFAVNNDGKNSSERLDRFHSASELSHQTFQVVQPLVWVVIS